MNTFVKNFLVEAFRKNSRAARLLLWLIVLAFFFQVSRVSGQGQLARVIALAEPVAVWTNQEVLALGNQLMPGSRLLQWIERRARPEDRFLVYRQAEFAYYLPNRRWIYDFDPQLSELYGMTDAASAHRHLVRKNVRYAYLPNYLTATYYNSVVANVLGDASYARQVASVNAYRIMQVFPERRDWRCQSVLTGDWSAADGPSPTAEVSTSGRFLEVPSENLYRQSRWPFTLHQPWFRPTIARGIAPLTPPQASALGLAETPAILMRWDPENRERIRISTGVGPGSLPAELPSSQFASRQIQAEFRMVGEGFAQIFLIEYNSEGQYSVTRVWDAILNPSRGPMTAKAQFSLRETTRSIRLVVENGGTAPGWLAVQASQACLVDYVAPRPDLDLTDLPLTDDPPFGSFAEWLAARSGSNFRIRSSKVWSREDLSKPNQLILHLGSGCEFLCFGRRIVDQTSVDGRFFMQPAAGSSGGALIRAQPETGAVIYTGEVPTGLFRHYDVSWSEWLWGYRRARAHQDFLKEPLAMFAEWYLPNAPNASSRTWEFKLDASADARGSTIIGAVAYWEEPSGRTRASYLGPRIIDPLTGSVSWRMPLPPDARNVRAGFRVQNDVDRIFALNVRRIEILELEQVP